MLTPVQRAMKRTFDIVVAGSAIVLIWPLLLLLLGIARMDTGASGLFRQVRIGHGGRPFTINKIRTMRAVAGTFVTVQGDVRVTPFGGWLRRWKLDELPQLWNVLVGEMSFVGPRPDVPGFADCLEGVDRVIWHLRPGITGPASLAYRHEERLLAEQVDPERYNREVIWPDKVRINREYAEFWRFRDDLRYIWLTLHR